MIGNEKQLNQLYEEMTEIKLNTIKTIEQTEEKNKQTKDKTIKIYNQISKILAMIDYQIIKYEYTIKRKKLNKTSKQNNTIIKTINNKISYKREIRNLNQNIERLKIKKYEFIELSSLISSLEQYDSSKLTPTLKKINSILNEKEKKELQNIIYKISNYEYEKRKEISNFIIKYTNNNFLDLFYNNDYFVNKKNIKIELDELRTMILSNTKDIKLNKNEYNKEIINHPKSKKEYIEIQVNEVKKLPPEISQKLLPFLDKTTNDIKNTEQYPNHNNLYQLKTNVQYENITLINKVEKNQENQKCKIYSKK